MQDRPVPAELLKAVAVLLEEAILPQAQGRTAFEVRVAINALELVAREIEGADVAHRAELGRLERLLGRSGTLLELNRELCSRIAGGGLDIGDARLVDHLWDTTMEKLAVDQPAYAAYRDELAKSQGAGHGF